MRRLVIAFLLSLYCLTIFEMVQLNREDERQSQRIRQVVGQLNARDAGR